MTTLRLSLAVFALSVISLWPSWSAAQEPSSPVIGRPLTLEVARLSCPECACDRARNDTLMVKREYRDVHRKVSTRGPRTLMTAGLAGAGGLVLGSYLASLFVPLLQQDPTSTGAEHRREEESARRFQRRVLFTGGLLSIGALGVGLFGAHKVSERKRDGRPFRERDAQLLAELKAASRLERAQCRGVR
jgi:hypothetical protein